MKKNLRSCSFHLPSQRQCQMFYSALIKSSQPRLRTSPRDGCSLSQTMTIHIHKTKRCGQMLVFVQEICTIWASSSNCSQSLGRVTDLIAHCFTTISFTAPFHPIPKHLSQ